MYEEEVIIKIPNDIQFSDLKLSRNSQTGGVEFDWTPLERICEASGIDISLLKDESEDNVADILTMWYRNHLSAGGVSDPVMTDLILESEIEERLGGGFSYQPGNC
jgi:hypothetical protein